MKDIMRTHSITVRMTPRQAIDTERTLRWLLRDGGGFSGIDRGRLFSAAVHVRSGLYDAGWELAEDGAWSHPKEAPR